MSLKDQIKKAFKPEDKYWDKEASWVEIEKLLPQKKKRRPWIFWLFGICILLLFLPLSWNKLSTKSKQSPSTTHKINLPTKDLPEQNIEPTHNLVLDEDVNSKLDLSSKYVSDLGVHNKLISSTPKHIETQQGERVINTIPKNGKTLSPTSEHLSLNESKTVDIVSNTKLLQTGPIEKYNSSEGQVKSIRTIHHLNQYIDYSRPLIKLNNRTSPFTEKQNLLPDWEFTFIGGFGGSNYSVNSEDITHQQVFADLHQSSTRPQENIFVSGLFRRTLNSNWTIGSGLHYQRSFEWYDGSSISVYRDTITQDSAKFYTINGFTSFVSGEITRTITQQTNYESPIIRHQISIPIELSFRVGNENHALLTSGAFYNNFFYQHKGRIYDENLELLPDNSIRKNGLLKSNWVNSWSISSEYSYRLSQHTKIGLGLRYKRQINSSFQSRIGVNEKLHQYGLQVSWTKEM